MKKYFQGHKHGFFLNISKDRKLDFKKYFKGHKIELLRDYFQEHKDEFLQEEQEHIDVVL